MKAKKFFSVVLSMSLILASAGISGCSAKGESRDKDSSRKGKKQAGDKQELVIGNWGEYIDEETIEKFEAAYPQYEVVYRIYETNETMYANLDDENYDVIIPSEYMVVHLIEENLVQPIDWTLIPNVTKYMDPMFNSIRYAEDENISNDVMNYAVPYMYCTVGLVYDANRISIPEGTTDPKIIWGVLFDEKYAGQVGMYDSMRESIGVALSYLGYSINSTDDGELQKAENLLINQKYSVKPSYGIDNLKDKIASGELAASVAWSGDYIVMLDRISELGSDIDLRFVLPDNSNFSTDMMCIPMNARNYQGAHDFINFMYEPEIAANNSEYVGYSTPNVAARAIIDPTLSENPYLYPTKEMIDTLQVYFTSSLIEDRYIKIWNTVKANA